MGRAPTHLNRRSPIVVLAKCPPSQPATGLPLSSCFFPFVRSGLPSGIGRIAFNCVDGSAAHGVVSRNAWFVRRSTQRWAGGRWRCAYRLSCACPSMKESPRSRCGLSHFLGLKGSGMPSVSMSVMCVAALNSQTRPQLVDHGDHWMTTRSMGDESGR
jgi:hypothetical protein